VFKAILEYRLQIHEEFQGWVLLFATITCVWLFCLPCYCAGLSCAAGRRFAAWLNQRLPNFYLFISIFNCVFMVLIVNWLPDWTFSMYMVALLKTLAGTLSNLGKCGPSLAVIAAFFFALAFKDRIAQLFGFDHKTLFRFKVRDCFFCLGGSRFQPIELDVWKVDDLPSADPFSANNLFVEFFLGYNEPMRTRVHNNAGSGCAFKEKLQLNFDDGDDEETLFIFVKNQKVMGTSELARAEISTQNLKDMVNRAKRYGEVVRFSEEFYPEAINLIPRGKIWLRAGPVSDDDHHQSLLQELTSC